VVAELLYDVDIEIISAAGIAGLLLATEIGYQIGKREEVSIDDHAKSQINAVQAAILGLLALLLGFTFSMAMSRFETRKQMVLDESNAIGTAYLRAQLLPEPTRKEVSQLLRQYIEARLDFYAADIDTRRLQAAKEQTARLQSQLWSYAAAWGKQEPRAVTAGLLLSSLNEVIDLHSKGLTALENHVPEIIMFLLYFVALVATGLIGYCCGLAGRRNFVVTLAASVLIAVVIMVIVDLDRPRRGLIRVGLVRMEELRGSLALPNPLPLGDETR
jgi:hypothetical protein